MSPVVKAEVENGPLAIRFPYSADLVAPVKVIRGLNGPGCVRAGNLRWFRATLRVVAAFEGMAGISHGADGARGNAVPPGESFRLA